MSRKDDVVDLGVPVDDALQRATPGSAASEALRIREKVAALETVAPGSAARLEGATALAIDHALLAALDTPATPPAPATTPAADAAAVTTVRVRIRESEAILRPNLGLAILVEGVRRPLLVTSDPQILTVILEAFTRRDVAEHAGALVRGVRTEDGLAPSRCVECSGGGYVHVRTAAEWIQLWNGYRLAYLGEMNAAGLLPGASAAPLTEAAGATSAPTGYHQPPPVIHFAPVVHVPAVAPAAVQVHNHTTVKPAPMPAAMDVRIVDQPTTEQTIERSAPGPTGKREITKTTTRPVTE